MCRHLARLGRPITLDALLLEPEHSLMHQAHAPRFQTHGKINADGFGVGWYDERRQEPAVYRRATPIWSDATFASIAGVIEARAILAAVRSATPGFAIDEVSTAPFASGPWLFSLNGAVDAYWDGVNEALRARLSPRRAREIRSTVDSALLFALTLDALDEGAGPVEAVVATVTTVKQISGGRLNLLVTDGECIAATAFGNSLFVRSGDDVVVASEPWNDDPAWRRIDDLSVVSASEHGLSVEPI
jgi:glutamine amidotransferase